MNVKKSTAIASAMTGLLALGAQFIAAPAMAADDKGLVAQIGELSSQVVI